MCIVRLVSTSISLETKLHGFWNYEVDSWVNEKVPMMQGRPDQLVHFMKLVPCYVHVQKTLVSFEEKKRRGFRIFIHERCTPVVHTQYFQYPWMEPVKNPRMMYWVTLLEKPAMFYTDYCMLSWEQQLTSHGITATVLYP